MPLAPPTGNREMMHKMTIPFQVVLCLRDSGKELSLTMNKVHVKTNDTVVVLAGRDKGVQGKVMSVDPESRKVLVEGVSVAKRHKKPRKQGEPGGIITMETPIYASKVMRVCPKCNKPTRPAHRIEKDGKKVRICKKCDAEI